MSIPQQAAAAELLRRKKARSTLVDFSQSLDIPGIPSSEPDEEDPATRIKTAAFPEGMPGSGRLRDRFAQSEITYRPVETRIAVHMVLMMQAIQRCIEKPRGRLMIFAPPGGAKSTYASVLGSSWAMGRRPNTQVIVGSYGAAIAAKQSRRVRAIAKDPRYTAIWDTKPRLLDDQRAVDDWSLTNGSSMMTGGLLSGITGNRADLFIIDDPVMNREQADSPTVREKTYNEYIDTVMTRAKPWMSCIIIQTRWHEEDLSGSILPLDYNGESGLMKCRDGQTWEVLCIPAEAERDDDVLGRKKGEFFWPEWFPPEHWSTWRDNPRAARTWAALYQQRPAPFTGVHFNREMFKMYDPDLPRGYM
jgi:hypothetical protein